MMFAPDFGLMFLALLTLLAQLVILVIALACGIRSLRLLRHPAGSDGSKRALIALGLCAAVEVWSVLFFTPWRFPNARPLLWIPLVPLAVAGSAVALWAMRGWPLSGTVRLMAIFASIALTTAGGVFLQRWDFRRENRHWARTEDEQAGSFLAAANAAERCEQHGRRGEPCERCKNQSPDSNQYYAEQFKNYAQQAAERAKFWRRRMDNW
jgi:hypothetical protein